MTALRLLIMSGILALGACAEKPGTEKTGTENNTLKLYVMDCGTIRFDDIAAFGITNEETATRELTVPCYLIDHPDGLLVWDTGLDPAIAGMDESSLGEGTYQVYKRSVIDQLSDIGLSPEDIDLISLSHFHFDHAGAANYFPAAELLIQETEYEAAFVNYKDNPIFSYSYYKDLADNPRKLLSGDHDVFGDGSVQIISAPGHTPGHQVLFIDLPVTGPLVLSGDLYHFRESRKMRRVPVFNTNAEETLQSMDRVEAILVEQSAALWIQHDKALADTLNMSPAYYE